MITKNIIYLGEISRALGQTPDIKRIYPNIINTLSLVRLPSDWTIGQLKNGKIILIIFKEDYCESSEWSSIVNTIPVSEVNKYSNLIDFPISSEIESLTLFSSYITARYSNGKEKNILFFEIREGDLNGENEKIIC